MSTLVTHANDISRERFGDLTDTTERSDLSARMPVMATPAAVAAGVTVTAAAFGVGFAVEEAADG
jgi:hypothetical protein